MFTGHGGLIRNAVFAIKLVADVEIHSAAIKDVEAALDRRRHCHNVMHKVGNSG